MDGRERNNIGGNVESLLNNKEEEQIEVSLHCQIRVEKKKNLKLNAYLEIWPCFVKFYLFVDRFVKIQVRLGNKLICSKSKYQWKSMEINKK